MLGCGQRLGKSVGGVCRARQDVLFAVHPDEVDRFCRRVRREGNAHLDRAALRFAVHAPVARPLGRDRPRLVQVCAGCPVTYVHAVGLRALGIVVPRGRAVDITFVQFRLSQRVERDLSARLVAAAVVVDLDVHSAAHHLVGHRRTDGIVEFRALFVIRIVGFKRCDGHKHRHAGHAEVVIIAVLRRVAPAVEGFEGEEVSDPFVVHGLLRRGFDPLRLVKRKAHTEHHRECQCKGDQSFHAVPSPQLTLMLIEQSFPS